MRNKTLVAISLITKDEAKNILEESEELIYLHGGH